MTRCQAQDLSEGSDTCTSHLAMVERLLRSNPPCFTSHPKLDEAEN